ncbi:MAG: cell division protein FtsQ/DivIB [Conexibacteraceae bacterium]|nr:cell division protein FtsQ/DivIB [Conexibacteraceae bacterium]
MISGSWVRERRLAMPRLLPRRVRSLHTLGLVMTLALLGWLGWTWYKGSSFVKVHHVTVTGLSGPDIPQIRDDLTSAALTMTTLNIDMSKLDAAVSQYAFVRSLTVTRQGAHGVLIRVDERVPVARVKLGTQVQFVDGAGLLLPSSTSVHGALPLVPLAAAPAGTTITAGGPRAAIAVLAAAPYALLRHITNATSSVRHGVIVQLRRGPQIYFGPDTQLAQKWEAVGAVLRDTQSGGADYIDVSDPARPAAGAGVSGTQATTLGLATSANSTTSGG